VGPSLPMAGAGWPGGPATAAWLSLHVTHLWADVAWPGRGQRALLAAIKRAARGNEVSVCFGIFQLSRPDDLGHCRRNKAFAPLWGS